MLEIVNALSYLIMRRSRLIGMSAFGKKCATMNLPVFDEQQPRLRVLRRRELRESQARQLKDFLMPARGESCEIRPATGVQPRADGNIKHPTAATDLSAFLFIFDFE